MGAVVFVLGPFWLVCLFENIERERERKTEREGRKTEQTTHGRFFFAMERTVGEKGGGIMRSIHSKLI